MTTRPGHRDIMELFRPRADGSRPCVKVVAPMVRYSKLPFRLLSYAYGADLCFTPMIVAESFNLSAKSRDCEFKTNELDRPLVVQFAANSPVHFGYVSCFL